MTLVRASAQNIEIRRNCTWCVFAWLRMRATCRSVEPRPVALAAAGCTRRGQWDSQLDHAEEILASPAAASMLRPLREELESIVKSSGEKKQTKGKKRKMEAIVG